MQVVTFDWNQRFDYFNRGFNRLSRFSGFSGFSGFRGFRVEFVITFCYTAEIEFVVAHFEGLRQSVVESRHCSARCEQGVVDMRRDNDSVEWVFGLRLLQIARNQSEPLVHVDYHWPRLLYYFGWTRLLVVPAVAEVMGLRRRVVGEHKRRRCFWPLLPRCAGFSLNWHFNLFICLGKCIL